MQEFPMSVVFVAASAVCLQAVTAAPVSIGSRLEPLLDNYLIERMSGGAKLRLHEPVPREVVLTTDKPWEGNLLFHVTVFWDSDRYRMYYRGQHYDLAARKPTAHKVICYAESRDGIHWERPELGIVEHGGSKRNNIILNCKAGVAMNGAFAVFKDDNPECRPDAKYKAVATNSKNGRGLSAYKSADGIRWSLMADRAVITKGAFDSHNLAFWDGERGQYRAYYRDFRKGVRDIRTCTSKDFINWSKPVWLKYPGAPNEHLYTNAIRPYSRAPHICLGFPKRFVPSRNPTNHPGAGVSDGVFMSSRDRLSFRRWPEAFLRPGPEEGRWVCRNNFFAWGMAELAPGELSLYATEGYYRGPASRLRRYTVRTDGFVSANAPLRGGELITKPIVFSGRELCINFSTSAAGNVRVEIQNSDGERFQGYRLVDCPEIYGDEIEQVVSWKRGSNVSELAGKPVRLRLVLRDADLYALRFR